MRLSDKVRGAVERRLSAIEAALAGIEGLKVERRGDTVRLRGRRLVERSLSDMQLRFAGRSR
ncbi:MAG: hypothetical protein H0W92_04085 [Sphingomonas sp.]|nr:hypothetical protein [Sphingomonas sp.]